MSLITVVIPFWKGDADLAVQLLEWVSDLGGCKKYDCVLITDPKTSSNSNPEPEKVSEIQRLAKKNFKTVQQIWTPYRRRRIDGSSDWPVNANWAFFCTAMFFAMSKSNAFLWLEPDCVPIKEGWLDAIEEEYSKCGKPMLGPVLQTNMPSANPTYMNGTSVFNASCLRYFDSAMVDFLNGAGHAFDVAAAAQVIPHAHPTRLIQHFWGSDRTTAPIFKAEKTDKDPWNVFTLGHLFPEAVLYHRVKDSSLIDLLREKRNERTLVAA